MTQPRSNGSQEPELPPDQAPWVSEPERYYVPEPGLSIRDYTRIIRERVWILVLAVFLGIALSALYCVRATPVYVTAARLEIMPSPTKVADMQGPRRSVWAFGINRRTRRRLDGRHSR